MTRHLDTFTLFLRTGLALPGGGYALVPRLERELVSRRALLSAETFHTTVSVAQCLPGVFSLNLGWFPATFLNNPSSYVLPAVTLCTATMATLVRMTRSTMLEVLKQDYIRTARAKGLSEKKVIYHHAFRNTLIPLVTMVGGSLPGLFSGALITETLFAIPGIGWTSYQAMTAGDIPFSMFYLSFLAILTRSYASIR